MGETCRTCRFYQFDDAWGDDIFVCDNPDSEQEGLVVMSDETCPEHTPRGAPDADAG